MSSGTGAQPRRLSIKPSKLTLPSDALLAAQEYINLRQLIRDAFESFLRNLNLNSLHKLEQEFERHGGDLNSSTFLKIFLKVFPEPAPKPNCVMSEPQKRFVQQMACLTLFECVDVDQSGEASWMEFVEFVCAIAEELRMQAAEESGQTFDFHNAEQVAVPFRPAGPKCLFDKAFFWPGHPSESAIVFEEGQPGFHLHRPKSLARKRRIEGHTQELLSATFLPEPFRCTVTSGNDNLVCFWDANFNLVRRWTLDHTWTGEKGKVTSAGVLCWCHEIKALYAADHFSQMVRAWHIRDMDTIRAHQVVMEADKPLSLAKHAMHANAAVQDICWMGPLKCLATASLDTTVQIFDMVEMKRMYVLVGHKRGLTCLRYCPKNHMLLSGGFDNYINIWDPGAGTLSFTLEGHECSIAGICAMPDTDYEFMSVDFEGQVRLWDVRRLVCLQNFCATDRQAEKNGELEALEPRAICPLNRDRVLISGRRMVVFDREASDPRVTADWPIHALAFNERRIEIVTPIKNDLYVWCALTGQMRTVHDNVIEGTITALTIGLGCRRVFVGADDGEILAVNYACGALLKKLQPHAYEVTQITCIPEKVLTLSVPEKVIVVHDDNDPERAAVLKRIDVSGAGSITQFAFDGRDIIAGVSEEQTVVWYNMFGKEVSNTLNCEVMHNAAVTCCVYFQDAPLLATADAEGSVIFWSVPPLRTYSFFNKLDLDFGDASLTFSISALALSWPDEEFIFAGVERGRLACFRIRSIVENAKALRREILRRKESGEAAEAISGRIWDAMPKPCDSPEYVLKMDNVWLVDKAHRGSIDRIVVCRRKLPVVLTLGSDACVRIWSHETGEALGTLEQGLPEGLSYERETTWRFPMEAHEELQRDLLFIEEAAAEKRESGDDDNIGSRPDAAAAALDEAAHTTAAASAAPAPPAPPVRPAAAASAARPLAGSQSSPDLRAAAAASGGGEGAAGRGAPRRAGDPTASRSGGSKASRGGGALGRSASGAALLQGGSAAAGGGSRLQALQSHKGSRPRGEEWYAGPYATEWWSPASTSPSKLSPVGLPKLKSGLSRPNIASSKSLVAAARRLHGALGDIDTRGRRDYY